MARPPPPPRSREAPIVTRVGAPSEISRDLYHFLLVQSWRGFYGILVALYLLANCVFATLYMVQPGAIAEAGGGWLDEFFFSVETMATVGYGVMHPQTLYAHCLVIIEILFGVLAVPVATGLTIAKFSRPSAGVVFSRKVVSSPFEGIPTLMFRVANARAKGIVEAHMKITMLRMIRTVEGHTLRRLIDLPLLRDSNPSFALSWTLLHPINENSPLHGMAPEEWLTEDFAIICILTGLDETTSVNVHARYMYYAEDVALDRNFHDIITIPPDGNIIMDFSMFHEIKALDDQDPAPEPLEQLGAE